MKSLCLIHKLSIKHFTMNHHPVTFWICYQPCSIESATFFFFFKQKTEEEAIACCKRCYLSIWLSAFVLCRIITQSRVDTNVPQCCLQRLLKEGSLTCLLNSPQRKLLAFRSRDLCQLRCKSKLRFCFCTSSVGLFSRPLAQLNMLVTNHKLQYVSVGKVVFG